MSIFEELEKNKYQFLLFVFLVIILFYFQKVYREKSRLKNLLKNQKKLAGKLKRQERKILITIEKLTNDTEKIKERERKLQQEEKRIENFANQLFRKEELFTQQLALSSRKEEELKIEKEQIEKIKSQVINNLENIIPMGSEEAEKKLFSLLKGKVDRELNNYKEEKIKRTQEEIQAESTKLICLALEKYSSELIFPKTTSVFQLENRQIISKLIGKEGRNINFFRRITGTEVTIDSEADDLIIQISSFNPLRREIAGQTLQSLIKEENFSPAQIEKTFQKVNSETDELIIKNGEMVLRELELVGIHPELIKYLGKLKYRTSYGQNVLEHSLEVAKLAGTIATELNLDTFLARRAGLFHDIGKAVDDNGNYSHVLSGIDLARKLEEPEIVINAIAAHHRDYPADNLYSLIVIAADKLSAARPGVRGYQLESYVKRMNSLESIAKDFPGIKKSYAFQAGREVWVIADAEELTDHQTWEVSQKIKKKIKEQIIIPGEVTINVIREKRFVEKLSTRSFEENTTSKSAPITRKEKDKPQRKKRRK